MTDTQKLRELMLHVAWQCATHQLFGMIKLNKILFFSDMKAFAETGRSITGAAYEKREFGPVAKGINDEIDRLVSDRAAVVYERDMPDLTTQKRLTALRKADLSCFSAQEIAFVNDVINWTWSMSAEQLSEMSHDSVGWEAARMHETIPAGTALIPRRPIPLSDDETALAEQLAAQASPA